MEEAWVWRGAMEFLVGGDRDRLAAPFPDVVNLFSNVSAILSVVLEKLIVGQMNYLTWLESHCVVVFFFSGKKGTVL